MLDILQLRVHPEELDQLHICQVSRRSDNYAAFTVKGKQQIWPLASWGDTSAEEKINVRLCCHHAGEDFPVPMEVKPEGFDDYLKSHPEDRNILSLLAYAEAKDQT